MNVRRKGARGEVEIANILKGYGFKTQRTAAAYMTGKEAPDVSGLPGFHLEVKRVERLNVPEAMRQAERDAEPDEKPLLMHRRNREQWLVTMRLTDFMDIYRKGTQ